MYANDLSVSKRGLRSTFQREIKAFVYNKQIIMDFYLLTKYLRNYWSDLNVCDSTFIDVGYKI